MKFLSRASEEFWQSYHSLPEQAQKLARKQYQRFAQDPFHPSLHFKPAGAFWSVRISRSYRALAVRKGQELFWFWIGSHARYEELLKRAT